MELLAVILLLASIGKLLLALFISTPSNTVEMLEGLIDPDKNMFRCIIGLMAVDGLIGLISSLYILNALW